MIPNTNEFPANAPNTNEFRSGFPDSGSWLSDARSKSNVDFSAPYGFGEKVKLRGAQDILAWVSGYSIRADHFRIGCQWWKNGETVEEWLNPEMVEKA